MQGSESIPRRSRKKTVNDVKAGFTIGPLYREDEVKDCVADRIWTCTQRFPVEQKGGVREDDSAKVSWTNPVVQVKKSRLPITDVNAGVPKRFGKEGRSLRGVASCQNIESKQ